MKSCPYCLAEIPDRARKCQHCGEWIEGRPERRASRGAPRGDRHSDPTLGRAANRFVSFYIALAIVGGLLALVFFFAFFLPQWNKHEDRFDQHQKRFEERWNEGPRPPFPIEPR
jgi:hypothetical protein